MATYNIEPERKTLHGHFSPDLPPVLTIDPGDTVTYRTLDASWGLEPMAGHNIPRKKFEPRDPLLDQGHALCGPIEIRGARPGMTLGVRIDEVRPGSYGWTLAGGWSSETNDWLGVADEGITLLWSLDPEALLGRNQLGHTIALRPFMGVMGMPPAEPGIHPTAPPRVTGGNIDCKELVPGSTLYLPIEVPGALFSVGDGHAVQGDGEVSTTAIECPMERVTLTFSLHEGPTLKTPRANTPAGWITLGFHGQLQEANMIALDAMLDLMIEHYSLSRLEALAMASLVVDMRVTQIVNGVRGVHAVLPHGAI
ncbi:MAG: acetamidase/formamidase family protein [Chloroflexota bacterium]